MFNGNSAFSCGNSFLENGWRDLPAILRYGCAAAQMER